VKHLPEHLGLSYDYTALNASPGVWHISYFSRNPQVPQPFLPPETSLNLAEQLTSNLVTLVHDDTDLLGTLLPPNLAKIVTNPAGGAKNALRSDLLKRLVLVKSTTSLTKLVRLELQSWCSHFSETLSEHTQW
jgi:hypothetical protein